MEALDLNNLSNAIGYIISVVIGSVGYRYLSGWWQKKASDKSHELSYSKMLIDSLMEQMKELTLRINDLENENKAYHLREIEVTKQLATAQSEVEMLRKEIQFLKQTQTDLVSKLEFYKQKKES
jgi:chromosome segregation ATPase